jgi:CHAD domain-containing protein
MRTRDDLLDRRPEEGARLVALDLVADVDAAGARLAAGNDTEALHDFRVAIRRLRSTVRAYRPWLRGGVRPKDERRLRKLSRATTAARDAEVHLEWLEAQRSALAPRDQAGLAWLTARLAARRADVGGAVLLRRWQRAGGRLRRRLLRFEVRLDAEAEDRPPPAVRDVLAPLVLDQLEALGRRLARVRGAADEGRAHRARIDGKRLRYLLEPLRGNPHADASRAVKQLKGLQDVLGDLHDSHVLAADVAAALDAADGDEGADGVDASPRDGLRAIDRLVRERRDALWAQLERARQDGTVDAVEREVRAVAAAAAWRERARTAAVGGDGADEAVVAPPSPS